MRDLAKRAQGLSMNTVVALAMAVIVLLVVATFFTGGFSNLAEKLFDFERGVTGDEEERIKQIACNNWCIKYNAEPQETRADLLLDENNPYTCNPDRCPQ